MCTHASVCVCVCVPVCVCVHACVCVCVCVCACVFVRQDSDQCMVFQGEDHMTCLHYAAKSGHVDIIQYILDINAVDVNATVHMLRRSPHPVFDHYM